MVDALEDQLLAATVAQDSSQALWSVEEVAGALRVSGGTARRRLDDAARLVGKLPNVLHELRRGVISAGQARAIAQKSVCLPDEVLGEYQAQVLKRAAQQTVERTRQKAAQAAASLNPATAEEKSGQARDSRCVFVKPADDGMAWLSAYLPAADAMAIFDKLTGTAKAKKAVFRGLNPSEPVSIQAEMLEPGEPTMDQLRADTLIDFVLSDAGDSSTVAGKHPAVQVVVGLNTLTGQDDEPGWLDGYGPITAGYARQVAHDPTGTWRRLITDPATGKLLDYGTERYRPPQHLADHVITRDGHCQFPFCNATARNADLDHIANFPDGPTADHNLQALHRRHHNAKTHGGWHAEKQPNGDTKWTSPLGYEYLTSPDQRWTLPKTRHAELEDDKPEIPPPDKPTPPEIPPEFNRQPTY